MHKVEESGNVKEKEQTAGVKADFFFSETKYKHFQDIHFHHHLKHKISISLLKTKCAFDFYLSSC